MVPRAMVFSFVVRRFRHGRPRDFPKSVSFSGFRTGSIRTDHCPDRLDHFFEDLSQSPVLSRSLLLDGEKHTKPTDHAGGSLPFCEGPPVALTGDETIFTGSS